MITLTIGGNDAGFGGGIRSCVAPDFGCDESNLDPGFDQVADRVADVITELRAVAPAASIFVLGYPYVTPSVGACEGPRIDAVVHLDGTVTTVLVHESAECEARFDSIQECAALSARAVLNRSGFGAGAVIQFAVDALTQTREVLGKVDFGEARFLWRTADRLNGQVREAARRSGAHFVDVVGEVAAPGAPGGFVGHSPCAGADAWLNGFVDMGLSSGSAASDGSFHPNQAGQRGYADILEQFIRDAVTAETAVLNAAGLPVNPDPQDEPSDAARSRGGSDLRSARARGSDSSDGSGAADASGDQAGAGVQTRTSETAAEPSVGYLVARRVVAVSGCGSPFASPGEQVRLVAEGFAADASVSFTAQAASLGTAAIAVPMLASVTADADGVVDVLWSVPSAPAASVDAAPRGYLVNASGVGPGGGTHSAYMIEPLVAYPATAPCAQADTAATTLGQSVQVQVLSNDTAPTGGSLDASSVEVLTASGGSFSVDAAPVR